MIAKMMQEKGAQNTTNRYLRDSTIKLRGVSRDGGILVMDNFLENCVGWSPGTLFMSAVGKGFLPVSLSQKFPFDVGRVAAACKPAAVLAAVDGKRGVAVGTFEIDLALATKTELSIPACRAVVPKMRLNERVAAEDVYKKVPYCLNDRDVSVTTCKIRIFKVLGIPPKTLLFPANLEFVAGRRCT